MFVDGLVIRLQLVFVVILLLSVRGKTSICQWPSKLSGSWPLAGRSLFCGGLMEASVKGLRLWVISFCPQQDNV